MRARVFLAFLLALAPLVAAGGAIAQPAQPLDRLLPQIRRDHPGQFLDAEGITRDGNPGYRLKWMNQGRVTEMDVDARTGRVLGQGGFERPRARGNDGVPPDRRMEGREETRSYQPRNERQDDARFGNRRQFSGAPDSAGETGGFTRPRFGQRNGDDRPVFGGRIERGGNDNRFGGFGRADRGGGSRNFGGGGGRDRRNGR